MLNWCRICSSEIFWNIKVEFFRYTQMHNTSNGMSLKIMTFFSHVGIDPINWIYAVLFMYVQCTITSEQYKAETDIPKYILRERERLF